jgi:hypothetical protein
MRTGKEGDNFRGSFKCEELRVAEDKSLNGGCELRITEFGSK